MNDLHWQSELLLKVLQKLCYKVADMGVDFAAGETGGYEQYQIACKALQLDPILLTYVFRDDSGLPFNHWLAEAQEYMRVRGTKDENIQVELAADRTYGSTQAKGFWHLPGGYHRGHGFHLLREL